MREIKFRAKALNSNKWIYRQPFHIRGTWYMYNSLWEKVPIQYKTLGQFTGLHDKNGKEIYEGDILGAFDEMPLYVEHSKEYGSFCFVDKFDPYGTEHYTAKNISYEAFEIIGNIYENPELMEGK